MTQGSGQGSGQGRPLEVLRPQAAVLSDDALVRPGDPCTPVTVTAADGARLTGRAHGGHITGWVPAGAGAGRLWLSPSTGCGPGVAIRGGVPVIFPQFSGRGPLPKHGVARDRPWRLDAGPDGEAEAVLRAVLTDDAETRAVWPHRFTLLVETRASGRAFEQTLAVTNEGEEPFTFTAALHAYLSVGSPAAVLRGLGGLPGEDNAAGGASVVVPEEPLATAAERDVAVRGVTGPVVLDDPALGPLTITAEGFADRVVWNPGPGHTLSDVPAGAEAGFVCVEPAALDPVTLDPGGTWSATWTAGA